MEDLSDTPSIPLRLAIVCQKRPPSWDARTKDSIYQEFGEELKQAYDAAGKPKFENYPLYGLIYCFICPYRRKSDPDADNISKRIWDILGTADANTPAHEFRLAAYQDDKQVMLRLAGIFEIAPTREDAPTFELPELTDAPTHLIESLAIAI